MRRSSRFVPIVLRGLSMSSKQARYRSWRKRVAGALFALALSGAGVFALAAPASAAPADCGLGYHCSYSGYNYGNDAWQQPSTHKFLNCADNMAIGWRTYNNVASSAFNNGRTQVSYLYPGQTKTGTPISFAVGRGTTDLGSRSFNDTAESGYFDTTRASAGGALCR